MEGNQLRYHSLLAKVAKRFGHTEEHVQHLAAQYAFKLETYQLTILEIVDAFMPVTYSLTVSNVGDVRKDEEDFDEIVRLYESYKQGACYSQVTLWASDDPDPIRSFEIEKEYVEGDPEEPDYIAQHATEEVRQ